MNEKFFNLKRDKQDSIINAAYEVFAYNSYKHSSTDLIVQKAGISKGLLFHYFISKLSLYSFLFDYATKFMLMEYSRAINIEENNYFTIVKQLEKAKLSATKNYPNMHDFIQNAIHETDEEALDSISNKINIYNKQMNDYYSQADLSLISTNIDKDKLTNIVDYTIQGITREHIRMDNYSPSGLYNTISEYLDSISLMLCH